MRNVMDVMEAVHKRAMQDEKLRRRILATKEDADPIGAFCEVCRGLGQEIYEIELILAGEEFYAEMKRSTNGGGENSPILDGQDDIYELFLAELKMKD